MSSNAPDESCLYPYSSGIGAEGVLGQGDTKDSAAFSPVHGVKSPVMVACGPHNTMFVDTKNKIYVCGLSQSKKDKSSIACSSVSEKPNDGEDDFQSFNLVVPICLRAPQFMDFKVAQISLGSYHALLLTTTGIVYAWGSSADGQLGLGTNISSSFPERVGGLSCVKQINCGVKFSAAVTDWGELYMWGENTYHQLGTGDSLSRYSPTLIKYLKNLMITQVACGNSHTVCLTSDYEMYTWGQSTSGGCSNVIPTFVDLSEIAVPPVVVSKVACGYWSTTAVLNTGRVYEWDLGCPIKPVTDGLEGESVRSVACGGFHTMCVTDSALVYSWGKNSCFQLARPEVTDFSVVARPGQVSGLTKLGCPDKEHTQQVLHSGVFGSAVCVSSGEYHNAVIEDQSPRFRAFSNLLSMTREHFRELSYITIGYNYPLVRVNVGQPSQTTSTATTNLETVKKRKSSFFRSTEDEEQPQPSLSPTHGTQSKLMQLSMSAGRVGSMSQIGRRHSSASFSVPTGLVPMTQDDEGLLDALDAISVMYTSTGKLLENLDKKMERWTPLQTIADVFLAEDTINSFRKYIEYSDLYNEAQMTLYRLRQGSSPLAEKLRCAERSVKLAPPQYIKGDGDLNSLLITPIQYVAKLSIGLRDLLEATPANHNDHDPLVLLCEKFQLLFQRINQNFQFVDSIEVLRSTSDESGTPKLMGGTLRQLVSKMTSVALVDPQFKDIFLTTFPTFCTPKRLMTLLIEKYDSVPESVPGDENYTPTKERSRVLMTFVSWISTRWNSDFKDDKDGVFSDLLRFIESHNNCSQLEVHMGLVKNAIVKQQELNNNSTPNKQQNAPSLEPRRVVSVSSDERSHLTEYPPAEVARCLAIQDHKLLCAIKSEEMLGKGWEKSDSAARCPGITAFTTRFNAISAWTNSVVAGTSSKTRLPTLNFIIDVAEACKELNDVSAFVAIVYGLLMAPEKAKKDLSHVKMDLLKKWEALTSPVNNYKALRKYVSDLAPPVIPFFGITIKDLTFIEDGNKNYLIESADEDTRVINFYKRRKCADVILSIKQFQQVKYPESPKIDTPLWNLCFYLKPNV